MHIDMKRITPCGKTTQSLGFILFYFKHNLCESPPHSTSPGHRHHGLRVVRLLQAEAFDSRQGGDDHVGLVGGAGPVVGVQFEARGAGTGEQALRARQAELLARPHVAGAAVGRSCRGWGGLWTE